MSVASEIHVIDLRTLQGSSLLSPDVWRKKEYAVTGSAGRQGRPASFQLLDYDPNVLVTEVLLLLDEVPNHTPCGSPGDDAVETRQTSFSRANVGPRHPLPQSTRVHVKAGRGCCSSHVHEYSMFIINEL